MRKSTILLVEDNQDDEALTLRALKSHNLANDVVVARDGQQALDYLFRAAEGKAGETAVLPELVLLDIKLPGMDGLEVLRRLRQNPHTRRLPVVMLTSSVEETDRLASYDLGANSYVRKPVDFVEFSEAIKQLDLYWLVLNVASPY
jgi:CheY-like chemotaxis protein